MIRIGQNAQTFASRGNLDAASGAKAAQVVAALSDGYALKQAADAFADPDLVSLSYDGGADGHSNEVNYLRTGLLGLEDLWKILNGQTPTKAQPHNYLADLRYLTAVR